MKEILPIFISTMVLVLFSQLFSPRDPMTQNYVHKEKLFYIIATISMVLFVGLRTRYNDTSTYKETYIWLINEEGSLLQRPGGGTIDWLALGTNPAFTFVQNIFKHLGFSTQTFLLLFSIFYIVVFMWFIQKYSKNFFFSVFLFFTLGLFSFSCAAIKQCTAISFGLIAIDMYFSRKRKWWIIPIIIGSLFHPYVLLFLIVPFVRFKPWTNKSYWLVGGFFFVGITLQVLMRTLIDITTMLGESYADDEFAGAGVNPLRVLVYLVPIALSFIIRKEREFDNSDEDIILNVFTNLSMINGLLMFIALFGSAIYFGRLSDYFTIFSIVVIPYLISKLKNGLSTIVYLAAFILYFIFFSYECLNGGLDTFDNLFKKITVKEYIESLNNPEILE